jgi:hypothetical protein
MASQQIHKQGWNQRLKRSLRCITSSLIGFILVLVLAAPGSAQKAPQFPVLSDHLPGFDQERSPFPSPSQEVGLQNPQEFENFVDQLIGEETSKSRATVLPCWNIWLSKFLIPPSRSTLTNIFCNR